jgi:hypothetical protein
VIVAARRRETTAAVSHSVENAWQLSEGYDHKVWLPFVMDQTYRTIGVLNATDTVMHEAFWVGMHCELDQSGLTVLRKE